MVTVTMADCRLSPSKKWVSEEEVIVCHCLWRNKLTSLITSLACILKHFQSFQGSFSLRCRAKHQGNLWVKRHCIAPVSSKYDTENRPFSFLRRPLAFKTPWKSCKNDHCLGTRARRRISERFYISELRLNLEPMWDFTKTLLLILQTVIQKECGSERT